MFIQGASLGAGTNTKHTQPVKEILLRAQLPSDVLAIAFNIIVELTNRVTLQERLAKCPVDLLVVSALNLAMTYALDRPPPLSYWSRDICNSRWTALEIDRTVLRIFSALDWRLHNSTLPRSIEDAQKRLFSNATSRNFRRDSLTSEQEWSCSAERERLGMTSSAQLKGVIEDRDSVSDWLAGHFASSSGASGHDIGGASDPD